MGLFGGDKKKEKKEQEAEGRRSTQRRSRRIVTPGSKPGGASGAPEAKQPRPGSSAVVRQRGRAPNPDPVEPDLAPPPIETPAAPDPAPFEIGSVDLTPADNAPASGLDLGAPISGPSINKGDGKKPITESPDLEFSGSLGVGVAAAGGASARTGDAPLLDFLVNKASLINDEQAGQARAKAASDDLPIDIACTQLGFIDEEQLVNALTQECWVPHLKVDKYEIRKKALDTIAEGDARQFSVLPVDKLGSILNLAMVNPLDVESIRVLESKTGLDIKKVVATRSEIDQGIEKYYGGVGAKEGGLEIAQDHESRRVTQMLSKGVDIAPIKADPEPALAAPDLSPAPVEMQATAAPAPMGFDDVADIDDLLGGDEEVQPSIVEPITISDDELEPEVEEDDLEVLDMPAAVEAPDFAPTPAPAPEPAGIDIGGFDLSADDDGIGEPSIAAAPEPAIEAAPAIEPAPAPAPAAAAASAPAPAPKPKKGKAAVDLIPVMEEEFQHAITHGKARIFQKWTSLQTRNRILNAVLVENELDPLLSDLYAHGQRVAG
ncbi:MAG: hypothetical protein PF961_12880 [Planctomycetota bacterium]|jgi:hypothetical protein|nr:hypothetical protein [Planctomycetota bacterium]